MTLDEKLTELESRHTVATDFLSTGAHDLRKTVMDLAGIMGPNTYRQVDIRDQYGVTGAFMLHMTQNGQLEWQLLGQMRATLDALR